MKRYILTTFLTSLITLGCINGQTNKNVIENPQQKIDMNNFEYSFASAHPNAKTLMKDSFLWSPIEESAPFGSDDGSNAAHRFKEWRNINPVVSPTKYLEDLFLNWNYPYFNLNEMDTSKIQNYINTKAHLDESEIVGQIKMLKEINNNSGDSTANKLSDQQLRDIINSSQQSMGGMYLLGKDNAIIGVGFAQFVLEGKIDKEMKVLTVTAIKRQLLPMLIHRYEDKHQEKRVFQLTKMLELINKVE